LIIVETDSLFATSVLQALKFKNIIISGGEIL